MQLKYVKTLCQAKTNIQYETTKTRPAAAGGATLGIKGVNVSSHHRDYRILLSIFFFHSSIYPPSELHGTRPKPTRRPHARMSVIWKCISEISVIPSPKIGGPKPPSTTSQLNGNFNGLAYIFGIKHDIHNRASALETTLCLKKKFPPLNYL